MTTKVIKVGNSYGVRLSSNYMAQHGINPGDQVDIRVTPAKKDPKKAIEALRKIAAMNGAAANIDIEQWEAERRAQWQRREEELRDIFGH